MASTVSVMRLLPVVFTMADYIRTSGVSENTAKVALGRLVTRQWVKPAGPRTGLFFNLFLDPRAADNHALAAVKKLYPSVVVVGAAVLHAHGWTTQIPHVMDVAILSRASVKQIDGINMVERPRQWFVDLMKSHDVLAVGTSPFAVESVTPQFALDDARAYGDLWLPDEDDLDMP